MGSFYVCGRCTRRLALLHGKLVRSYFSLGSSERRDVDVISHGRRGPTIRFDHGEGSRTEDKTRAGAQQRYHGARKSVDDKVLETLFSSNRAPSELPTRSRYSRTPIAQEGQSTTPYTPLNVSVSTHNPTAKPAHAPTLSITPPDSLLIIPQPARRKESPTVDHRFDTLRSLLQNSDTPLDKIWESCCQSLHAWKTRQAGEWTDHIKDEDFSLLCQALHMFCKRSCRVGETNISPSAVIKFYLQCGVMGYWWQDCLWIFLARFFKLKYESVDGKFDDNAHAEMKLLLGELTSVWRLYLKRCSGMFAARFILDNERGFKDGHVDSGSVIQPFHQSAVYSDEIFAGWPDFVCARRESIDEAKNLTKRFFYYVPTAYLSYTSSNFHGRKGDNANRNLVICRETAAAAALTLHSMRYAKITDGFGDALPEDIRPFYEFLESVIGQLPTAYRSVTLALAKNNVPPDVIDKALRHWLPRPRSGSSPTNEKDRTIKGVDRMSTLMMDMDEAVKKSDAELAVQAWTKAQREFDRKGFHGDLTKLDNLFSRFLSAFFELRRAETATSVWNYMVQKGHRITKVHWTIMLHGCIRAHDVSSLQGIWTNMLKSNIIPDTATWTTYIRGLIKCRQWREGLDALDQLGRVWKDKTNTKISHRHKPASSESASSEGKPTPSLAPVKAALDALIDIEKYELLDPILKWASSHGLNLDTHAYNILLRPLARTGDPAAIQTHLATMATYNCQPDITTFTIILSSLVSSPNSNFRTLDPSGQESTILSLLNDMRAAGIPPNTYTYSILLSALLQNPSTNRKHHTSQLRSTTTTTANVSAARTVLAHMHAHSIPPTPHICTIVLSHYFSQSPPDLEEIHSLWRFIESFPLGTAKLADPIFYDRMIEGLADAGQAEDSLGFVKGMVKEGKVPGWVALGRCLESLYGSGKMELVRWLVGEVEREGGLLRWGEREMRGRGWWGRRVKELKSEGVVPMGGDAVEVGGTEGVEIRREAVDER